MIKEFISFIVKNQEGVFFENLLNIFSNFTVHPRSEIISLGETKQDFPSKSKVIISTLSTW